MDTGSHGRRSQVLRRLLHSPWTVLVAAFVASRLAYAALGVAFDATPHSQFWQYLDPLAVERDPLGSLADLHVQPPLFNAGLAAAQELSPFPLAVTEHAGFLLAGLVLTAAAYLLCRRIGFGARAATVVALVVSCNPTTVLYENWLFYTYPVAVLLVVAAVLAGRYASTGRLRDGVLFFAALGAVMLMRSLFHPLWFLVAGVGLAMLTVPVRRREVVLVAVLPLLVVLGIMARNQARFDQFTTSTWFGMNLARATTLQIPEAERARLVEEGSLSVLALRPTFEYYHLYADTGYGTPPSEPTGSPVLDHPVRSDGSPNFNYLGYLGVYGQYQDDAVASIRLRPGAYVRGQALAYATYLNSPTDFDFLDANRARIASLDRLWRTAAYGELPPSLTAWARPGGSSAVAQRLSTAGVLAAAALMAVAVAGLRLLSEVVRRRRPAGAAAALLFSWATVVYVTVAGNALDVGENQRFRFEAEPLLLVLSAWVARALWLRWHRRTGPFSENRDRVAPWSIARKLDGTGTPDNDQTGNNVRDLRSPPLWAHRTAPSGAGAGGPPHGRAF